MTMPHLQTGAQGLLRWNNYKRAWRNGVQRTVEALRFAASVPTNVEDGQLRLKGKCKGSSQALSLVQFELEGAGEDDSFRGAVAVRVVQWQDAKKGEGHEVRTNPDGKMISRNLRNERLMNPTRPLRGAEIIRPNLACG